MSIGRGGIKNLTFIGDDRDNESIKTIRESEDNDSTATVNKLPELKRPKSKLFIDDKLTKKGIILIIALAGTIFASCSSYSLLAPFL